MVLALVFASAGETSAPVKRTSADKLEREVWPFAPMPFLTDAEVRFFKIIKAAMPECHLFAQVQLSQLLQITDLDDEKFWLNRISRMSVDFVLVLADCQTVVALIELDDWTHEREDRIQADNKKDKAIWSAGLLLHRYQVEAMPSPELLRQDVITAWQGRQG